MAKAPGVRIYDHESAPITTANPLPVIFTNDPVTISVATITIGTAVGINTVTATDPLPVTLGSTTVGVQTITATSPLPVTLGSTTVGVQTITATSPLPVTLGSTTVGVQTITATSPINTNYANMQRIENSTDFTQSITYAYHTTTTEYYVSSIAYQSATEALSITESYIYTGTDTADFRVTGINLS